MNRNESERIIPVVFAVNNGYVPYLYISISSLIKHVNKKRQYHIYVLHTGLESGHIERLEKLKTENVRIECENIENSIKELDIKESIHLTVETCFRLFIAELFPQYSKVIYIDSDTLLREDVAKLYDCKLEEKVVGAVHDVVCTYLKDYYEKHLGMEVEDGFNAGILIIDTYKFRKSGIKEQCIKWLVEDSKSCNRKYIYMDQDVLNKALLGKVCFLESVWNFQWQYLWRLDTVYPEYQKSYIGDSQTAKIIHYAGDKKPWQRPDLPKADLFWGIARESVYYEEILFINLKLKTCKPNIFENYLFPFSKIPQKSKIILYGAGNVGRTLYKQNKAIGYTNIVLWVDKNYRNLIDKPDAIFGIDELKNYPLIYDYVLIAIEDERICNQVKQVLMNYNIPENKIVWDKYSRD